MTCKQSVLLDKRNGQNLWEDPTTLDLTQIIDYNTFIDKGHHTKVKLQWDTRFKPTKFLMSNIMADTKLDGLLMVISPIYH
jgi:hypothetical protein